MKRIAIVYGGDSIESDISILSYKKIKTNLINEGIITLDIFLDKTGSFYINHKNKIKNGHFEKIGESCFFKTRFCRYEFDVILPIVHGKGVEDGTLGAYFDLLKIPCMYSGVFNSSLLQNKSCFKKILNYYNIPNTRYVDLSYSKYIDIDFDLQLLIKDLNYPLIVKPNNLGSSVGVSKVYEYNELISSIDDAFKYDDEILIEEAVCNLKEVNIAALGYKDDIIFSELETVSKKDDILSFYDKYLLSKDKITRIIPSDISSKIKEEILKITKKTFICLNCFGVNRFDFLIDELNNEVFLNEINLIPGSLAYYLFEPVNISTAKIIQIMYDNYCKKLKNDNRLIKTFYEDKRKDLLSKE